MIEGRVIHETLTARDFTVNLIGQIPEEADTVLHQLQRRGLKDKIINIYQRELTVEKNVKSVLSEPVPYYPHLCG